MMITLSKTVVVSVDAIVAKHNTINGGLFKFVSVRPVLVHLFAACALFHVFFTHVIPLPLSKRLTPERNGALPVNQALSNLSLQGEVA